MNRILYLSLFIFALSLFACKAEEKKSTEALAETQQVSNQEAVYPMLPVELHNKLYNEVDFLDFIFHTLPFSMNQAEKESVQANIAYIGRSPVMGIPAHCKPIAREFFQIQGEIVIEADIYFTDPCYFYVFVVDGKPSYANMMSETGRSFFQNTINQALAASKQIQGQ